MFQLCRNTATEQCQWSDYTTVPDVPEHCHRKCQWKDYRKLFHIKMAATMITLEGILASDEEDNAHEKVYTSTVVIEQHLCYFQASKRL